MGSSVKMDGVQRIATLVGMAVLVLFSNDEASAFSAPTSSNSSGFLSCSGSMEECLIVNDANDLFSFADAKVGSPELGGVTKPTSMSGKPAIGCGKDNPYTPCVPGANHPNIPESCGTYKRGLSCK
ncbi:hypothetical protein J1N35_000766 [Gossypium stocksii]|uniref:Uncharacterized protein n=1 Tax=Gossypium stocksii TaxID=47602 RepID=A0A9D3WJC3_9ROSI|nr:hypothetical protein J1N35_000766 [Gossypium stocksii]